MSNKSNKTNGTSKTTNKNVRNVSYGKNSKNGKGGTAAKKKQDRASWVIAGVIIAVALVGIILLAVFAGGSPNKVNGQQSSPSRQQQTVPDCCQ